MIFKFEVRTLLFMFHLQIKQLEDKHEVCQIKIANLLLQQENAQKSSALNESNQKLKEATAKLNELNIQVKEKVQI